MLIDAVFPCKHLSLLCAAKKKWQDLLDSSKDLLVGPQFQRLIMPPEKEGVCEAGLESHPDQQALSTHSLWPREMKQRVDDRTEVGMPCSL